MIQKINRITRNYLHKSGLREESYINKVQATVEKEHNIPSEEIEHILYSQISPFRVCEISFSEDIVEDMRATFEKSENYEVEEVEDGENLLEIEKRELVENEIVNRKIGKISLDSHIIYVDFVRKKEDRSLQASPSTEKTLNLLEEYFETRN